MNTLLVWGLGRSGTFRCVNTMLKRKDISNDLMEAIVAAFILGREIRPFPNNMKSIISQWGRLFTSGRHWRRTPIYPGVDVPGTFTPWSDCTILCTIDSTIEMADNPTTIPHTLHVNMLNDKVCDSTIRKPDKYGMLGRGARRNKHLIPKVTHAGGGLMVWGSFSSPNTVFESTMNSVGYTKVF